MDEKSNAKLAEMVKQPETPATDARPSAPVEILGCQVFNPRAKMLAQMAGTAAASEKLSAGEKALVFATYACAAILADDMARTGYATNELLKLQKGGGGAKNGHATLSVVAPPM